MKMMNKSEPIKWKIWFKRFDTNGRCYAGGVSIEEYSYKGNAVRAAVKRFSSSPNVKWVVSQTNPWVLQR